jgi:hypothetical protein
MVSSDDVVGKQAGVMADAMNKRLGIGISLYE